MESGSSASVLCSNKETKMSNKYVTDLTGQDRYGKVWIERKAVIQAMQKVGLKLHGANWRVRSAAIRFEGTIDGIEVMVIAYNARHTPHGWELVKSNSPQNDDSATHIRLHGYMAENVTLRGKGRDGKAWQIYARLTLAVEKYRPAVQSYVDQVEYEYMGEPIMWGGPGLYIFKLSHKLAHGGAYFRVESGIELNEEDSSRVKMLTSYDITEKGS